MTHSLLITCEHASNFLPKKFSENFSTATPTDLNGHKGWDIGAMVLARHLANDFKTSVFAGEVSRLLIDLNRTEDAPDLFSQYSRNLTPKQKLELLKKYHRPHWRKVRKCIGSLPTIHLGIHSFTPVFKGMKRSTEIGLLFDPSRGLEASFCQRWKKYLMKHSSFKVHLNRPYRGTGNGLISSLRPGRKNYLGIEVEVSHGLLASKREAARMGDLLVKGFRWAVRNEGLKIKEFL